MGLTAPTEMPTSTGDFQPIPPDNYQGVCIGIIELGKHTDVFPGSEPKENTKVKLQFELPGFVRDDGKTGVISTTLNYGYHEKSAWRITLESWLGADWSKRFGGQGITFLLGMPAMVNVDHKTSAKGNTYAFIKSVGKYPRGMAAPVPTRDEIYFDIATKALPSTLSVWDAEKIRASKEYRAGGFTDDAPQPKDEKQPTNLPPSSSPTDVEPFDDGATEDDDAPFVVAGKPRF